MKRILIFLIAIIVMPAALQPQTMPATSTPQPQALPNAPSPAPPDPAWDHVLSLARGQPIVVSNDYGPPVHCLFASATDTFLFCDPQGNPAGVGYRFDRASVISVEFDLPAQNSARLDRPQRNYHPVYLASILAGGLIVGMCATRTMDDGNSAKAGAIGALVVGIIGAPLAFLPQPQDSGFAYRPRSLISLPTPRFAPHPHLHLRPADLQ